MRAFKLLTNIFLISQNISSISKICNRGVTDTLVLSLPPPPSKPSISIIVPSFWKDWPSGNFSEPLFNSKGGKQREGGTDTVEEQEMFKCTMGMGHLRARMGPHMAIRNRYRVAYSWRISSSPGWLLSCTIISAGVLLACQMAVKGPLLTLSF